VYFPIFRTKTFELIALRELAETIAASNIVPVLEPVGAAASLRSSLESFVEAEMTFALIVNPIYPQQRSALTSRQVYEEIVREGLDEADFYPTLYVTRNTSLADINAFSSAYSDLGLDRAYFVLGDPHAAVLDAVIEDDPARVMLRSPYVSASTRDAFALRKRVLVEDPFHRQPKNAEYPEEEFFSDRHITIPNDDYLHFGDYSIVGDYFQEGGGLPFAVTLHHVIKERPDGGNLFIKHFVSDSNETRTDVPGKFLEALDHLIAELPAMGEYNETDAVEEYRGLYNRRHFPGLGVPKRLGIIQHLSIISELV
jgi:hypothetical protein